MAIDDKTRISVTVTRPYLEGLDILVKRGIYLNQGAVIRESLRSMFIKHGIPSFISVDVIVPDKEVSPENDKKEPPESDEK